MRTMHVDLDLFRELVNRDSAIETPTRFKTPINLGRRATLVFSCPKDLPAKEPGCPFNPFTTVNDLRNVLSQTFGGEYKTLIMNALLGDFASAAGEEPDQFTVNLGDETIAAPQALVMVEWPLDNPPQDVGLDSDFAAKHGAVYYHRVDHTDSDADFDAAHGTDIWVMSAESLGDFRQEIQRAWDTREAGAELAFRRYDMEAPYFRERIRKNDTLVNSILHWRLTYGEEHADLTAFPDSEDELSTPIYYNTAGLKLLRDAIDVGLSHRLDCFSAQ